MSDWFRLMAFMKDFTERPPPVPESMQTRRADSFSKEPDPNIWTFSHCPIDVVPDEDFAGCEGCAGWGQDCGAYYQRAKREADKSSHREEP